MLTKPQLANWLKDLRSGEHHQAWGTLARGPANDRAYCCLGLLAEQTLGVDLDTPIPEPEEYREKWSEAGGVQLAPDALKEALDDDARRTLYEANDTGLTFPKIADLIEEMVREKRIEIEE